jgi:hypothetical protein
MKVINRYPEPIEVYTEITMKDKSSGELLATTTFPAVKPARKFLASAIDFEKLLYLPRKSSYSIVNPSDTETAVVIIEDPNKEFAECLDPITIEIPPMSQVSKFSFELFPDCRMMGVLTFTSNVPIGVAAFEVYENTYNFVAIPVREIEDDQE